MGINRGNWANPLRWSASSSPLLAEPDGNHLHQSALCWTREVGVWLHAVDRDDEVCPLDSMTVDEDGQARLYLAQAHDIHRRLISSPWPQVSRHSRRALPPVHSRSPPHGFPSRARSRLLRRPPLGTGRLHEPPDRSDRSLCSRPLRTHASQSRSLHHGTEGSSNRLGHIPHFGRSMCSGPTPIQEVLSGAGELWTPRGSVTTLR